MTEKKRLARKTHRIVFYNRKFMADWTLYPKRTRVKH